MPRRLNVDGKHAGSPGKCVSRSAEQTGALRGAVGVAGGAYVCVLFCVGKRGNVLENEQPKVKDKKGWKGFGVNNQ